MNSIIDQFSRISDVRAANRDIENRMRTMMRETSESDDREFRFDADEYLDIHRRLFKDYVDTKRYAPAAVRRIITEEKSARYNSMSDREKNEHCAEFLLRLWRLRTFEEGNVRATAVFVLRYLRSRGFRINAEGLISEIGSLRMALVEANRGDMRMLREVLRAFVLWEEESPVQKVDIRGKANRKHIEEIREFFGVCDLWGREDVQRATGLSPAGASRLIARLRELDAIEAVRGYGKGKYRLIV